MLYCLLFSMLGISLFGTLDHKKDDAWCYIVTITIAVSSVLPLGVLGLAMYFYVSKFWDPE